MLWLNQECGCQKLDLEPGARDRVGPPLLQPLGLGEGKGRVRPGAGAQQL